MDKKALHELAEFVDSLRLRELDPRTCGQAKIIILDTIGAILAGSNDGEINRLYEFLRGQNLKEEATVFGKKDRIGFMFASMVNGAAGSTKEWDEGNSLVFGHPAIQIVPAAIAAGEWIGASGGKVLEGFLAGYEVAGRISRASKMRPGFHPSGTWGTVGAAVACGKVLDLPVSSLIAIMNTAASFAISANVQSSFFGKKISEMYAAMANYLGIFSCFLHRFGFSAPEDSVEVTFGRLLSESFNSETLLRDLGKKFLVNKNYFKIYPACRFAHSALDALSQLMKKQRPDPKEIEEVEVYTYRQAMHLDNRNPGNVGTIRFSLPYLIAIGLSKGKIDEEGIGSFQEDHQALRPLAERVRLVEEEGFNSALPMKRPTRVRVSLKNGQTLEGFVENCRGGEDDPYTEAELREKFVLLSSKSLRGDQVGRVMHLLSELEDVEDIRKLTEELRIDS